MTDPSTIRGYVVSALQDIASLRQYVAPPEITEYDPSSPGGGSRFGAVVGEDTAVIVFHERAYLAANSRPEWTHDLAIVIRSDDSAEKIAAEILNGRLSTGRHFLAASLGPNLLPVGGNTVLSWRSIATGDGVFYDYPEIRLQIVEANSF